MIGRALAWLAGRLCGPERSWVEEEAYLAGYRAEPGTENPFSDFRARRAWREGQDDARDWLNTQW